MVSMYIHMSACGLFHLFLIVSLNLFLSAFLPHNSNSFPHDAVLILYLPPLMIQVAWKATDFTLVLLGYVVGGAAVAYAIDYVNGRVQMYSLLYLVAFVIISFEIERYQRSNFIQNKHISEGSMREIRLQNERNLSLTKSAEQKVLDSELRMKQLELEKQKIEAEARQHEAEARQYEAESKAQALNNERLELEMKARELEMKARESENEAILALREQEQLRSILVII